MTLFKTRQPFRDGYEPDTIVARDETISKLTSVFQEFVDGFCVPHLFVRGDRGSGKRTVIRHVLTLAEQAVETEIEVVTIDCGEHDSLYKIYLELAYRLCEDDYPRGTHQMDLEEAIFQEMSDPGVTWYILLENLEALGKDNLPFHELQDGLSEYGTDHTECGIIGISNSTGLHDHLSGDVLHKPYMFTVKTNPYQATELREILQQHAEVAFIDDGFCEPAIQLCAAIIGQQTGSAADALQLLELAGYVASHSTDADQVTETHVQTAKESLHSLRLHTTFTQELNPKEQLLCTIIAAHTEVDEKPVSTESLVEEYQEHCGSFDLTSVKKRRLEQLIVNLREKRLVSTQDQNIGRSGGMWSVHETPSSRLILRSADITSGRFTRLLRKYDVSLDHLKNPDEVDIEEFLSNDWSSENIDVDLQQLNFYPT
jgi:cell division control protein 6